MDQEEVKTSKLWTAMKQDKKLSRKEAKLLWPEAKEVLEFLGKDLPKLKLIRSINILSDSRKRRFLRSKVPKYGSMNKGFTEEELVRFFKFVDDPKLHLLFSYQAILGLRIGEVVKIHIKDINLKTKELRIETEKAKRTDYLPIPPQLFDKTLDFITQNEDEIVKRKGHIFWAEYYPERNNCPHIATDFVRNECRRAVKRAGLEESYAMADGKTKRLLHRLTPHSLRHYAITNHARKNNGNVLLASKFARHSRLETTMTYIHTDKEELYRSILNAQEDGVLSKVKKMQEKSE
jgi:integrase